MADVNIIANYMFCYAQINQYTLTTEQTTIIDNNMNVSCSMPSPTISTGVNINASAMECNCSMSNPTITLRNLLAIRKTFTVASKNLNFLG